MSRLPGRLVSLTAALLCVIAPAFGDEPTEKPSDTLRVSTAVPAGTRTYVPGTWGLVEINVSNRSDGPAKVLGSLHFQDANRQYGREFLVPPRSRRFTWHPVLVPEVVSTDLGAARFQSLTIDRTGPKERLIPDPGGRVASDGLLPVDRDGVVTCWIGTESAKTGDAANNDVYEMILAARAQLNLSRKVIVPRGHALPPGAETLQGIDQLVLSGDRPLSDAAGLNALRDWTFRGGRLWVLLDRVSPEMVERLFGDACHIQAVDRVGLTSVRIVGTGSAANSSDEETREFERPAEMVRVYAEGVELLYTVEGWPAAFVQRFGRGEVLFTTLDPRAWTHPPLPVTAAPWRGRPPSPSPTDGLSQVAGEPLAHLAGLLMLRHRADLPEPVAWEPLLTEQVGCKVVSRGTVLAVLGTSCSLLAASAVWLGRRRRLDAMVWVGPLVSLVSAAALGLVGRQTAEAVPPTAAEGQLIETTPGSAEVQASGLALLYSPETKPTELGAEGGGLLLPDMTGFSDETRRMIWTDWDRWHFENLTLPRGARVAPFQNDVTLETPVAASGSFGPDGFAGRVTGPLRELSDAVVATPSRGTLAARLAADGTFRVGPADVLPPGEFLADTLLSDAQRRRQEFYRRLFAARRFDDRPTLLAWVRPLDLGFDYPAGSTRTGEALALLPLEIERTPPGTAVTVPAPFVRGETANGPGGRPPSPLFNPQTGEPVERAGAAEAWVRFAIPPQVLPLDLESVTVTVTVSGAVAEMELLGQPGGRTEALQTWSRPSGTSRVTVRGGGLDLDERGGLRLGLRVRGSDRPVEGETASTTELRQYWRVDSMGVEAAGRTRGAAGE